MIEAVKTAAVFGAGSMGGGIAISLAGVLTTAGNVMFSGDQHGNLIGWNPKSGVILWHFHFPASVSNGPMTFERDGKQYLVAGAGDTLYAFTVAR